MYVETYTSGNLDADETNKTNKAVADKTVYIRLLIIILFLNI